MGKVYAEIPDDFEQRVRIHAVKRFGGRRGSLQKAVIEGLKLWLKANGDEN